MKKIIMALAVVAILGAGTAAALTFHSTPRPVTSTYFLMDTVLTITTTGSNATAINERLHALASGVDAMTSYYNPSSETARVNAAAGSAAVPISTEYARLLGVATDAEAIDHGKTFDIAISPVSSLWGFTTRDFRIPDAKEIADALAYGQSDQLVVSGMTARLKDPRARIDLGGIAKGYSLDVMADYLASVSPQPRQVIVDFGGNLLLYSGGKKTDWKVGIQDPRGQGIIGYVVSGDAFVATSGDYERYFVKDGKRYCHIIDPSTGYPASLNQSVTLFTTIQPTHGALGDALGKSFFCSGAKRQSSLFETVRSQGIVGAVIVDAAGGVSTLGPIALVQESAP